MDLCNSADIAALLAEMNTPQRRPISPRMRKGVSEFTPVYAAPERKAGGRRCACGTCCTCLETVRWERIFQQKFADPLYYAERGLPHNSPLESW